MKTDGLVPLLEAYRRSPSEFRATSYWQSYEKRILQELERSDAGELRSGKHPVFSTFGFGDTVYHYHPNSPLWQNLLKKAIHKFVLQKRGVFPYRISLPDLREMAYRHCELLGETCNAIPIGEIETSTFGKPADLFEISDRKYTVQFLAYYVRYCFAHGLISFKGDETVVELSSGSGTQAEILKKLYPELTILCFDLPAQLFLCETYLKQVLGDQVVGSGETLDWTDLSGIKPGHVHMFGNWQFPLLLDWQFDVFWSAASFGEMEPDIVANYLRYVHGRAAWVYLFQARHGKELRGKARVEKPVTFDDYNRMLHGYSLTGQQDGWTALGRLKESGGYFEAVWRLQQS
jgi:putative sugar O-methyltransferase